MDISPQSCVFLEIMPHYSTPFFPLQLQNSYNSSRQFSPLQQNIWSSLYFFTPLGYHVFHAGSLSCQDARIHSMRL